MLKRKAHQGSQKRGHMIQQSANDCSQVHMPRSRRTRVAPALPHAGQTCEVARLISVKLLVGVGMSSKPHGS